MKFTRQSWGTTALTSKKIFTELGTLTIFSYRVTGVRVLDSKFLLYHFGIKAVIISKYHGTLIEPVYPIKEPVSLPPLAVLHIWKIIRFIINSKNYVML